VAEIETLVQGGIREVTLLGQNVNSYGRKEGLGSFAQLLARINAIKGLQRIRFTTSHPKDLSDELMAAFRDLEKVCPHIHLPVQSGSDRILKKMNRKYTRQRYLERVVRLRDICPAIAITSDIIVGFPGESQEDFQATLDLIERVRFDGLFAFIYSDRPNAPAAQFSGKLSEGVKKERLQQVLALQERHTSEKHLAMIGQCVQVLVEGTSKLQEREQQMPVDAPEASQDTTAAKDLVQWTGRTADNKIVNFCLNRSQREGNQDLTGQMVGVIIEKGMAHSLWGRLGTTQRPFFHGVKGDNCYAA
jgi:tRNA-2-methylthio-N6-dimethylallyladenosine synthase